MDHYEKRECGVPTEEPATKGQCSITYEEVLGKFSFRGDEQKGVRTLRECIELCTQVNYTCCFSINKYDH